MKKVSHYFFVLLTILIVSISSVFGQDELSYFEKAKLCFEKQQWKEGKSNIDEGLEESPDDSDLLMLNGKYFHHKKENKKARFNLIKAIQIDKNNTDAKKVLINVEMEEKHYSSAICYINELLEANPYWASLWKKKIEAYRLQGNEVEADRLLKRIQQIYPEDKNLRKEYAYSLKNKIARLKKEGKTVEATRLTNELVGLRENDASVYFDASNLYISSGNKDVALSHLNKALSLEPGNQEYVQKKAAILSDMGRYDQAIALLKKEKRNHPELNKQYSYLLQEYARTESNRDPYVLYGKIFQRNKRNREALNYLLNTSLTRGYDADAIYYISEYKKVYGEDKSILSKEYDLYKRLRDDSKSNKVLRRLHEISPEDLDVSYDYALFQQKLAQDYLVDENYDETIEPLLFLSERNDEFKEPALHGLVNSYSKLGRKSDAIIVADKLIEEYPENPKNYTLKASILAETEKEDQAMEVYEELLSKENLQNRPRYEGGYSELGHQYIKRIRNVGPSQKVFEVADKLLAVNPKNELTYRYALSNAYELNDYNRFFQYAEKGQIELPESIFLKTKLAEAHLQKQEFTTANEIVDSILTENQYNQLARNAKGQVSLEYAKDLQKRNEYDSVLLVANDGLKYDPENTDLKYMKGLSFESVKEYDSALYYQSFYEPSPLERAKFLKHLEWLEHKTYKNQVGLSQLISAFDYSPVVRAITTFEYTRFHNSKNAFTGRLNYTGREQGAGVLAQFEWYGTFSPKAYFALNAGYGSRYFPRIIANFSTYWEFVDTYEAEFGVGYRYLPNNTSLLNGVMGVSKSWDEAWLNGKVNVFGDLNGGNVFYNVLVQSKFYVLNEKRTFLHAMLGAGSIPETGTLDFAVYNDWNSFNTMVGLGGQYMINRRFTLGVLGSWYNIKSNQSEYRNLFNVYLQAFFSL